MTTYYEPPVMADNSLTLDPEDEFEQLLIEMVQLQRRKGGDYANPDDRWSNFKEASEHVGVPPWLSCEVLVATKQTRIKNLIRKYQDGHAPNNESLRDSLVDRAIYSIIGVVLYDIDTARK